MIATTAADTGKGWANIFRAMIDNEMRREEALVILKELATKSEPLPLMGAQDETT